MLEPPSQRANLSLLPQQAAAVGAAAGFFSQGGGPGKTGGQPPDPRALSWLAQLGYIGVSPDEGAQAANLRTQEPWPDLLALLGDRIEAVMDITPEGSPVVLAAAFGKKREQESSAVFSGRGPDARGAFEGALYEAFESYAAQLPEGPRFKDALAGEDLASGKTLSLPAEEVFIQPAKPSDGPPPQGTGTNGLAAGPTFEIAAANAVLELIERDAVAIWWRSGHRVPQWRPHAKLALAALTPIEKWFQRRRRKLQFLDVTSDLGVPTIIALSSDPSGRLPLIGAGADLSASEAAYKAASELIQMEANLGFIARNVEESGPQNLPQAVRSLWEWHVTASQEAQPGLTPGDRPRSNAPAPADWRPEAALATLRRIVKEAGLTITLVRLPELVPGIVALRAVSSALMDLHRTNERALEVPAKLGLDSGLSASRALNETPIPL